MTRALALLVALAITGSALAQGAVRVLHGCEPDKLVGNALNMNAGSVGEFYGQDQWNRPAEDRIDLTHIGLGGIDRPVSTGHVYIFVAWDGVVGGRKGWLASQQRDQGDVLWPAGFRMFRKLPFGIAYNLAWGGLVDFHLTGWPMPYIRLTQAQYGYPWTVLAGYSSHGAWTSLDLSALLPDNARLADIVVEVRYIGGSAGSGYVRSPGGSNPGGVFCGSGSPGSGNTLSLSIRTDSTRHVEWMSTGDVVLYITVLGYWMTEPA